MFVLTWRHGPDEAALGVVVGLPFAGAPFRLSPSVVGQMRVIDECTIHGHLHPINICNRYQNIHYTNYKDVSSCFHSNFSIKRCAHIMLTWFRQPLAHRNVIFISYRLSIVYCLCQVSRTKPLNLRLFKILRDVIKCLVSRDDEINRGLSRKH